MSDTTIESVFLDEPRRDGEYADGARVGFDGVTRIERREEFFGDHWILWFDVFKGADLFKSFGSRHVAVITYAEPAQ